MRNFCLYCYFSNWPEFPISFLDLEQWLNELIIYSKGFPWSSANTWATKLLMCYRNLLTHFTYWVASFTMSPCSSSGATLTTRGPFFFFFSSNEEEKSDRCRKSPLSDLSAEERQVAMVQGSPHCTIPRGGLIWSWKLAVPSGEGIHLRPGPGCTLLHQTARLVTFSKKRSCLLEPGLQLLGLFHLKVNKESILQWSNQSFWQT